MGTYDREALIAMMGQKSQQIAESDQILLHGYRVFVSQHHGGQISLLQLIEQSSLSAQDIISYLLEGGRALLNLNASGYIYNAFTLEHVIYHTRSKKIALMDHALILSSSDGKKGVKQLMGAPGHVHPSWLISSRKEFINGKRVKYSVKNDVYAFLQVADRVFKKAGLRTHNPHYIERLRVAREQIHDWKERPFEKLPHLSEVLAFLEPYEHENDTLNTPLRKRV